MSKCLLLVVLAINLCNGVGLFYATKRIAYIQMQVEHLEYRASKHR